MTNNSHRAAALLRLGETRTMHNGQTATIIRYGGAMDIDVRFEDGVVVPNRAYSNFMKGNIRNPGLMNGEPHEKLEVGSKFQMHNGQTAEVIAIRNHKDIDIKFEDGTVVTNVTSARLYARSVRNPNVKKPCKFTGERHPLFKDRTGETRKMGNGQMATIIRYGNASDIDIRFEDGTVVESKEYGRFTRGHIHNPNYHTNKDRAASRVGERRMMNHGIWATVTAYRGAEDIDVKFEDKYGTELKSVNYRSFVTGSLTSPGWHPPAFNDRKGEKIELPGKNLTAEIIRYGSCRDIDVKLSNGKVLKHMRYQNFAKGLINTTGKNYRPKSVKDERVGLRRLMCCGIMAEITKYRNSRDIDVRFDDGYSVEHVCYGAFMKGYIGHPLPKRVRQALG